MSNQELQAAISELTYKDFTELASWIDEYRAELWDQQIERDVQAGRLDELGKRADDDFKAGRCTPL